MRTDKLSLPESMWKNRGFWFLAALLVLKVTLAALFTSDYQNQMFIPFVDRFLSGLGGEGWNVYQYYYENGLPPSFPYPPLMLLLESVGGLAMRGLSALGFRAVWLSNLAFKLPLFLFDGLGMYFLLRMFPHRRRYTAVLYGCSPVILYACFMHGQLDIIPTVLFVGTLFYLLRVGGHRLGLSALLFSAAFLTKTHILAAFPLLLLFVLHKYGVRKAGQYAAISLSAILAGILPFWSEGLYYGVFRNAEQNVVTQFAVPIGDVRLYVPIVAVFLVYLVAYNVRVINDDLLIFLCGIVFSLLLALCRPMPGWYVWIVPFAAIFFTMVSQGKYSNLTIYAALNLLYLLYFTFLHNTGYTDLYFLGRDLFRLKLDSPTLTSAVFTCMCAILFYLVWQMYALGISRNVFYQRRNMPITIGVTGDSGSGKTTFVEMMERTLGTGQVQCLEGDGDHRWERGAPMWEQFTHLDPNANYLYRQAQNLAELRMGGSIHRADYDHATGKFLTPKRITAKKYVFLCGLHSLYLPQAREHLDFKVYMDADETLRRYWKLRRDTSKRGQTAEEALAKIQERIEDAEKYIHPQKQYADVIVRYFDSELDDCRQTDHMVVLSVRLKFDSSVDVEPLISELRACGITAPHAYSRDLEKQVLTVDGRELAGKALDFNAIAMRLIPDLDELTLEKLEYSENIQGVVALVMLLLINSRVRRPM